MAHSSSTLRHAIAFNAREQCSVSTCSKHRSGISQWCSYHKGKNHRYGHPLGHHLSPTKDYATELHQIKALVCQHSGHPGIRSALQWIAEWLLNAAEGKDVPGKGDMRRLHQHGVSPTQVLAEAAALFLHSQRFPQRLPDDERLTGAIAHNVLSLAPRDYRSVYLGGKLKSRYKPLSAPSQRAVGNHIRSVLSVLFAGMVSELDRQWQLQQDFRGSLRQPFTPHHD